MIDKDAMNKISAGESANELADQFWNDVGARFHQSEYLNSPALVLSPKQKREYQLALLGVPKFQYIRRKISHSYSLYPLPEKLFEDVLLEFELLGLIDENTLEEKYRKRLMPTFMRTIPRGHELQRELTDIIRRRELSPRFQHLWSAFIRMETAMSMLDNLKPYKADEASFLKNIQSSKSKTPLVEQYIYSAWLIEKGWHPEAENKMRLQGELAENLANLLWDNPPGLTDRWYFPNLKALVIAGDDVILSRAARDLKDDKIRNLYADGFFHLSDFPELLSSEP